jgi:hypothetical protein
MSLLATIVDWAELGKTVAGAAVAGLGATLIFALAVLGGAQLVDLRRAQRVGAAIAAGVLMAIALLAFAAAIVIGLVVITDK